MRLSDQHDGLVGHWFPEALFGPGLDDVVQLKSFPDLEALQAWMLARLRRTGAW